MSVSDSQPDVHTATNRRTWDAWTDLHTTVSGAYTDDLAQLRDGGSTLDDVVVAEVGDVTGLSLLHLQCHFGLDTLSWARLGASVTGLDFSDRSIAVARELCAETGLDARFVCADVHDLPGELAQGFDIVFTSDGVWPWLRDLDRWAAGLVGCLKPGGTFYMRDGHPIRRVLLAPRSDATGVPVDLGYVSAPQPVRFLEQGSYAVPDHPSTHEVHYWEHGLGEIVTALCSAGQRIEYLHEFIKIKRDVMTWSHAADGRLTETARHDVAVPRTFSVKATLRETDL